MPRPSSEFLRTPKTLQLMCFVLTLIATMALWMSTTSWSQAKPTAPAKKTAAPVQKTAHPKAKAPGWCQNAAPVVNGVATVLISQVGTSNKLKVNYSRVCIGATDTIMWNWSGGNEPADWSAEFFAKANPFHPKNKFGKGNSQSPVPSAGPNDYLIYKYVIHAVGYPDLDPDVIIRGG